MPAAASRRALPGDVGPLAAPKEEQERQKAAEGLGRVLVRVARTASRGCGRDRPPRKRRRRMRPRRTAAAGVGREGRPGRSSPAARATGTQAAPRAICVGGRAARRAPIGPAPPARRRRAAARSRTPPVGKVHERDRRGSCAGNAPRQSAPGAGGTPSPSRGDARARRPRPARAYGAAARRPSATAADTPSPTELVEPLPSIMRPSPLTACSPLTAHRTRVSFPADREAFRPDPRLQRRPDHRRDPPARRRASPPRRRSSSWTTARPTGRGRSSRAWDGRAGVRVILHAEEPRQGPGRAHGDRGRPGRDPDHPGRRPRVRPGGVSAAARGRSSPAARTSSSARASSGAPSTASRTSGTSRATALLTLISNVVTGLNLSDMATCYKAFHRRVVPALDLESPGFGVDAEITAKVARGRIPRSSRCRFRTSDARRPRARRSGSRTASPRSRRSSGTRFGPGPKR